MDRWDAHAVARRCAALSPAVLAAMTLGACGGGDDKKPQTAVSGDERAILATVDALQTASRRDDAERICTDLFAPSLADSIRRASKHSCQAEVHDTLTSPDAQLSVARKIAIKGPTATAAVREQNGKTSTVTFVKQGDRWRIARITPAKSP
jgi:ketosteroid isomerase-like protein